MSAPSAVAPPRAAAADDRRFRLAALAPSEGWLTVVLHAVVLVAAAATVARVPLAPPVGDLALLTVGGLLVGLALAKLRAPDLLAHLFAFSTGVLASLALTAEHLSPVGNRLQRAEFLVAQVGDWYRAVATGQQISDPRLFAVVLGITVWLVAYTSAWVLYRRGWLATAMLLPAAIATINLGYMPSGGTLPLLVIVAAGCVLAARHALFQREQRWTRLRVPFPSRLPWRWVVAGVNLALVTALVGWTLPFSTRDDAFDAIWDKVRSPVEQASREWQDLLARFGANSDASGSYASFGDQFTLGGQLKLSDEPVMVLQTNLADGAYLAGHRYDEYTGSGWRSSIDDRFDTAGLGTGSAPQMSFARDQGVHLTPAILTDRSQVQGMLDVLRPKGNLLFTLATYLTADRQTNVTLSWQRLSDQSFPLSGDAARDTPVDLRGMAMLLASSQFPPGDGSAGTAAATDPAAAARIAAEREDLRKRLLDVRWTVDGAGAATSMVVSGELPIYDDVQAVFSGEPMAEGSRYVVTGLESAATSDALRAAGTAYPAWVTDRYLQLPSSVTDRTRQLAAQLVAGSTNPFDAAIAVQDEVRQRIAYKEDIDPPPAGRDVVDYVLFDSQEGYCEYYASAMAVLLRIEGIPARVVGGYYRVPYDQAAGGFLYRERNAHLWVEVFFPGYGWIPFEPTASQNPLDYGEHATQPEFAPAAAATPEPTPTPVPAVATPAPQGQQTPPTPDNPRFLDNPGRVLGWAVAAILGALAVAGAAAVGLWHFRLRGLPPVGGLYARALRAGSLLGVPTSPSLTPREYADRLGRAIPSAQGPARVVAELYTEEQYAPTRPDPEHQQRARDAWTQLRSVFMRGALRKR